MNSNRKKKQEKRKNQLTNYAKYSNIAFQMIGIILVGVFGGMKLDEMVNWTFPVFTFVLTIFSVIAATYLAIKDFIRGK